MPNKKIATSGFDFYIEGNQMRFGVANPARNANLLPAAYSLAVISPPHLMVLVQSLVEQLCMHLEGDVCRRKMLFTAICQQLHHHRYLDHTFLVDDMCDVRSRFRQAFFEVIVRLKKHIGDHFVPHKVDIGSLQASAIISRDHVLLPLGKNSSLYTLYDFRYKTEFEELEFLGEGGFSTVWKARQRMDGQTYAVKKIPFRYNNLKLYKEITREVHVFACLSHSNIVGYKTAWIENNPYADFNAVDKSSEYSNSSGGAQIPVGALAYTGIKQLPQELQCGGTEIFSCDKPEKEVHQSEIVIALPALSLLPVGGEFFESPNFDLPPVAYWEGIHPSIGASSVDNCDLKTGDINEDIDSDHQRQRHQSGASHKSHSESDAGALQLVENGNLKCRALVRRSISSEMAETRFLPHASPSVTLNISGMMYIQMELCSESLRQYLDRRDDTPPHTGNDIYKKVNEPQVLSILRQVLKGIEYLHSQNLIHRDLKPQNILFSHDRTSVQLADFGLTTLHCSNKGSENNCGKSATHTGGIGTPLYIAPEQKLGTAYDYKVDMYSLGVIMLELYHPFGTRMERHERIMDLRQGIIPDSVQRLWPTVGALLHNLVHQDPTRRPSAIDVLASDLFPNKCQVLKKLVAEKDVEVQNLSRTVEHLTIENSKLQEENRQLKEKISKLNNLLGI